MSGTVIVTTRPETVTSEAEFNRPAIPPVPPVTTEAFNLTAELGIDAGTVNLLPNVTVKVSPTAIADIPAPPDTPVTVIVYWPFALAVAGVTAVVTTPIAAPAGLAVNEPMANIAAITPMTMSSASPKDVPILVFIYSCLLSSKLPEAKMTS
jgi:hypothetical protein